jgi:enoyl-CoA hydratase/carnithine racemase
VGGFETIDYYEQGGVAWVTLDRPEVHNAFNAVMLRELHDLWRSLRDEDSVRAVVLTGAGTKAFCTGIDRNEILDSAPGKDQRTVGSRSTPFMFDDPGAQIGPKSCDLWKPVVAAVNGMACGGAFYLLGEVDIIVASETATFFDPHVSYGMTAAFEPIQLLQKMPFGEIVRLSLLGNAERMSARRACEIGLVSEVVPAGELEDAARFVAETIASQPPLAVQGTLRALWAGRELSRSQALSLGYAFVGLGSNHADLVEGQSRFSSGRRSEWRLR